MHSNTALVALLVTTSVAICHGFEPVSDQPVPELELIEPLGPTDFIPYHRSYVVGTEQAEVARSISSTKLGGAGPYTTLSSQWLKEYSGSSCVLLAHSCTGALEIAAMLSGIGHGDEVILPSYTFASSANAFVLRGATPVFVDVGLEEMNMNISLVEQAITDKTKVIVVVHYAGVACDMEAVMALAQPRGILVIEDAAHSMLASYHDKPLGSFGHMATFSFHASKNIVSGEGGALLMNEERFCRPANYHWQKGTNRIDRLEGRTDKYTWITFGSSFAPPDFTAAFLYQQLINAEHITKARVEIWNQYMIMLSPLQALGHVQLPRVPAEKKHPAHIFWGLTQTPESLVSLLALAKSKNVGIIKHYVPLHSAPFGREIGRTYPETLDNTDRADGTLFRLPLWVGMRSADILRVVAVVYEALAGLDAATVLSEQQCVVLTNGTTQCSATAGRKDSL